MNKFKDGVKGAVSVDFEKISVLSDIGAFFIKQWMAFSDKNDLILPFQMTTNQIKEEPIESIFSFTSELDNIKFICESNKIPESLSTVIKILKGGELFEKDGSIFLKN